jgi:hypothetical protein
VQKKHVERVQDERPSESVRWDSLCSSAIWWPGCENAGSHILAPNLVVACETWVRPAGLCDPDRAAYLQFADLARNVELTAEEKRKGEEILRRQ